MRGVGANPPKEGYVVTPSAEFPQENVRFDLGREYEQITYGSAT